MEYNRTFANMIITATYARKYYYQLIKLGPKHDYKLEIHITCDYCYCILNTCQIHITYCHRGLFGHMFLQWPGLL